MKLGHFGALCCAVLAIAGAGAVYWDLQDGYFSTQLLFLPIFLGTMALALLLFPGGPLTFRDAARDPGTERVGHWVQGVPVLHRRMWLLAAGLAIYLSFWAEHYLEGKPFFRLGEQLPLLLVAPILGWVLRKELRRMW